MGKATRMWDKEVRMRPEGEHPLGNPDNLAPPKVKEVEEAYDVLKGSKNQKRWMKEAIHNIRLLNPDIDPDRAEALAAMVLLPVLQIGNIDAPRFFAALGGK